MTITDSPAQPFVAKWGIIGCGWISSEFCKDLAFIRPEVTDVSHAVVAVGSRDKAKAAAFIAENMPQGARAQVEGVYSAKPQPCGSYDEVYDHPDVDIIYIGTPNQSHFTAAKAALLRGKHVLVEKPACLNAAEWAVLTALAEEKRVFLMEGLWTRFQPLTSKLRDALHKDKLIGDIKFVQSDFSMAFYNSLPDTHRTIALEAAGGAMFDLGAYAMLPALIALHENPDNHMSPPEHLSASMLKTRQGTDQSTSFSFDFPRIDAKAIMSTSIAYNSPKDQPCVIVGTKGEIVLHGHLSRPSGMTIKIIDQDPAPFITKWKEPVKVDADVGPGFGLYFEADSVARSLRDSELQNATMPHSETALVLGLFDSIRKLGGYTLPPGLEQA